MVDDLFDHRTGERLSDYAQRMLDLMLFAKSRVEFEMGGGIDFDDALEEMREIIDGDGKALAVREVRKALDFARPYFPRLEIPHYPSDNDLIAAAMKLVRQHEAKEMLREFATELPQPGDEMPDYRLEIAEMMIAGASLSEILAAHPNADIDEMMRWHEEKFGDDLANTYAARQWLRQKGK